MTNVIQVDPQRPDPAALEPVAEILRSGGLVAFPTETVYGLGAHALDRAAVRRLFDAKGRPADDPLIVHVASLDDVRRLVAELPLTAQVLAARFWPGPLTLVLPKAAAVPDEVTAGLQTVAVRIPAHPIARALLEIAAIPVAAPSANLFSRPSPTRAAHVLEDLNGRIDVIIDGGATTVGVESTVLDLSGAIPTVLRPGAVTLAMLREVLTDVAMRAFAVPADRAGAMPSPGMQAKHYSPRAPLTLYEGETSLVVQRMRLDAETALAADIPVGVIAADEDRFEGARPEGPTRQGAPLRVVRVGAEGDLSSVAARLYAALRELDAAGVELILARAFPADTGLGVALQDRLRRAAGRIVRC